MRRSRAKGFFFLFSICSPNCLAIRGNNSPKYFLSSLNPFILGGQVCGQLSMKKRCRLYPHPWFPFASPIQFLPQVRPLNVKQPRTWSSGPSISSLFVKISPSLVAALLSPVYDSSGREEQNPAVMRFKAVLDAYVFYWTLPLGSALEFSCHQIAFLSPGYSEITCTAFEVRAACNIQNYRDGFAVPQFF